MDRERDLTDMVFFTKVKNKIRDVEHEAYLRGKRCRLKNKTPSIISNNCVAGVIYHDLGLRFDSPTVNLFFGAEDFVRFAENLEVYLSLELQEIRSDRPYPVGMLGDITIYFMHYKSFEEAKAKWEERTARINFDNLFFIMSEREGCTPTVAERFDRLPYRNKVLLTHLPMPQVGCAHVLAGFENDSELGTVTDMKPGPRLRRYIDDYDYVRFLNAGFAD